MDGIALPKELVQKLVDYLKTKPFEEVAGFIGAIMEAANKAGPVSPSDKDDDI